MLVAIFLASSANKYKKAMPLTEKKKNFAGAMATNKEARAKPYKTTKLATAVKRAPQKRKR